MQVREHKNYPVLDLNFCYHSHTVVYLFSLELRIFNISACISFRPLQSKIMKYWAKFLRNYSRFVKITSAYDNTIQYDEWARVI